MKTNKENKQPKKNHEGVETPPPPQVMDPSAPPEKQTNDEEDQGDAKRGPEKKKDSKTQKLAPKDEL